MASKRAKRRKACTRKNRYEKEEAFAIARRMRRQGTTMIGAYHCTWCAGWHVGHLPYKVRQSMRARRANQEA